MKHPNRNGKRAQRQQEAAERQANYDALSLATKTARAYERGGGRDRDMQRNPTREFARLAAQMDES